MPESDPELKTTPLHELHRRAGAKMVPFAGWEMPVQYTGVMEEHRAVRNTAGLFDVSHMGEIRVRGAGAEAFLQYLTPNDVTRLPVGRAHYSGLLTERGTYVDDLLVYHLGEGDYLLVVNAANAAGDLEWVERHAAAWDGDEVEVADAGGAYALLALQGPKAVEILEPLTRVKLDGVRYYGFTQCEVGRIPALVSRTGYTGEDGFELYVSPDHAAGLWEMLLEQGEEVGLVPAGLAARDTLRLEAAMALYGHELDRDTTPYEAGLSWVVKPDAGDFIGRDALLRQKAEGVTRKLIGFEVVGRGIARQGHPVRAAGESEPVGEVTSGTYSPTLERALGMAWVPPRLSEPGMELEIEVRGRPLEAKVVELPFYRREK